MTEMFSWFGIIIDFMRHPLTVGGFTFSYMDVFFWCLIASIIISAVKKIFE